MNDAGYGYQAFVEEGEEAEIRARFEVNVFGLFAPTRAVLPLMRARRRGHVINITSLAGLIGFKGSGHYAASKHAVEGWSDALAAEGAPLGINRHQGDVHRARRVPHRPGRPAAAADATRIADYAGTAAARLRTTSANSGRQAGDPAQAAEAMIAVADMSAPPRHLVLGAVGVDAVTTKRKERLAEIERYRGMGVAADFPED